jgi:hypothetical protein
MNNYIFFEIGCGKHGLKLMLHSKEVSAAVQRRTPPDNDLLNTGL